jgi:hypothetical protein
VNRSCVLICIDVSNFCSASFSPYVIFAMRPIQVVQSVTANAQAM